jgi:predicted ATP-dependent serine protease
METNTNNSKHLTSIFEVRTANQVLSDAASQPDPIELFKTLIIEGEIHILFADTGIGKSTLSVQIGIAIAQSFDRDILYLDLELSDKQFEKRYRNNEGIHFTFPERFHRAAYAPLHHAFANSDYDELFISSLLVSIQRTSATVVIIDNMTRVVAGDTDSAKNAIPIMTSLLKLKAEKKITFIILEHNKKVDNWRPICLNDLQGSKMKSNFADAVFTIGRDANDKNIRYIKQLKVRSAELEYDSDNVLICELTKEKGFLGFKEIGYGNELDLLRTNSPEGKTDKVERAILLKAEGLSNVAIARELNVSEGAIRKWIKKH